MWAGSLQNLHFIQRILEMIPHLDRGTYQTLDRIEGVLTAALEGGLDISSKGGTSDLTSVDCW
jgi:tRNA (guanine26-N2/guanine27-N2)-dimethyltransferase